MRILSVLILSIFLAIGSIACTSYSRSKGKEFYADQLEVVKGLTGKMKDDAKKVLDNAPVKFILIATCTLPRNIKWDNIKTSIDLAHNYKKQ